ncbi:TRAP transporter small permease [Aquabacter spiritensis]|uniref:TRAP transporter small permease protein n=1 Tax=Aquabacter spiritensis TaxID=933073 RepID=A0A4R3M119_9HYPH|nr:TRAP transporter small permease [Aquabacter spiritensis]TCT06682.1 TRAP-type C4-dicarboxylate transport system permease small subunit [Aquabacter spiritensis]
MIGTALTVVSKALLVIASTLAFLLCFVVCADVIGRVLFGTPLKGTPELVSSSIVIICYLQASYAILSGGMMQVDAFTANFPVPVQVVLGILGSLLGALLFGLIFWGSIDGFMHAWDSGEYEGEGALRVPMWPVRLAVLAGTGLALLAYLLLAARQVVAARRAEIVSTGVSH